MISKYLSLTFHFRWSSSYILQGAVDKMKVQLAMMIVANAILLAVIEVFIDKWTNKTRQTGCYFFKDFL